MQYRIAVCDDAAADQQYIAGLVDRWAEQRGHTVKIDRFPSAESSLFHYAEEKNYHILLLDIDDP